MRSDKGFTLIEVLIVVVIIATLAALIVPRVTGHVRKAKLAEAMAVCGMISRAEIRYYNLYGSLTLDLSKLDITLRPSSAFPGCSYYGWEHDSPSTQIGFGLGCDPGNRRNVQAHVLGMNMDVINGEPKVTHFWWRSDLPGQVGGGAYYASSTDWDSAVFVEGI
ncbi:MAG TPA: prepilin-type N-terminal cleavage/methylation domain-containing protein [Candidatus Omnitrophota bacterium]|nr:prepilin-type N-terminal cleavage/methylation domain-containing protein [Candidatus Omnitrophota bacterium]HPS37493.1 prepilin-type N-terminal cleavage/methylation domain-containing protein [Candidatus Omnitrophota bacterium]